MPEHSATIDGFNVQKNSIPANHMDMCKFKDPSDIGFKRVARTIEILVEDASIGE